MGAQHVMLNFEQVTPDDGPARSRLELDDRPSE